MRRIQKAQRTWYGGGGSGGISPSTDRYVRVDSSDTTSGYLASKLVSTDGSVTFQVLNPAGNEQYDMTVLNLVVLTVAQAQVLAAASGFAIGRYYKITDVTANWQVVLMALTKTTLASEGQGIYQDSLFTEAYYNLPANLLLRITDSYYDNDISGSLNIDEFPWNNPDYIENTIDEGSRVIFSNTTLSSFVGNQVLGGSTIDFTDCIVDQFIHNAISASGNVSLNGAIAGVILGNRIDGNASLVMFSATMGGDLTGNVIQGNSIMDLTGAFIFDNIYNNVVQGGSSIAFAGSTLDSVRLNNVAGGSYISGDLSTLIVGTVEGNTLSGFKGETSFGSAIILDGTTFFGLTADYGVKANTLTGNSSIDLTGASVNGIIEKNTLTSGSYIKMDSSIFYSLYTNSLSGDSNIDMSSSEFANVYANTLSGASVIEFISLPIAVNEIHDNTLGGASSILGNTTTQFGLGVSYNILNAASTINLNDCFINIINNNILSSAGNLDLSSVSANSVQSNQLNIGTIQAISATVVGGDIIGNIVNSTIVTFDGLLMSGSFSYNDLNLSSTTLKGTIDGFSRNTLRYGDFNSDAGTTCTGTIADNLIEGYLADGVTPSKLDISGAVLCFSSGIVNNNCITKGSVVNLLGQINNFNNNDVSINSTLTVDVFSIIQDFNNNNIYGSSTATFESVISDFIQYNRCTQISTISLNGVSGDILYNDLDANSSMLLANVTATFSYNTANHNSILNIQNDTVTNALVSGNDLEQESTLISDSNTYIQILKNQLFNSTLVLPSAAVTNGEINENQLSNSIYSITDGANDSHVKNVFINSSVSTENIFLSDCTFQNIVGAVISAQSQTRKIAHFGVQSNMEIILDCSDAAIFDGGTGLLTIPTGVELWAGKYSLSNLPNNPQTFNGIANYPTEWEIMISNRDAPGNNLKVNTGSGFFFPSSISSPQNMGDAQDIMIIFNNYVRTILTY